MELLKLISGKGFVMYSKLIAREVSANASIIYGQLASSLESFGSKNMLINIDGEDYFFLTSEVIKLETSLSYRQQAKAIKELEEFGLIKTVLRGVPARKHFHITNKIEELILSNSSSNKSAELDKNNDSQLDINVDSSFNIMSKLDMTKEQHKNEQNVPCIKKNKEKEQYKDNNENLLTTVNKQIADKLSLEYMKKGLPKSLALKVVDGVNRQHDIENYGGYLRTCLKTTLNRYQKNQRLSKGEIPKNPFDNDSPLSYFHDYLYRKDE